MERDSADDPKIIDCPQCNIKNPIESDICYNCGASLHEKPAKKAGHPLLLIALFVLFVVGVIYFYYRPDSTPPPAPKSNLISEKKPEKLPPRQTRLPGKAAVVKPLPESETDTEQINISIGLLRIRDIVGNLISEILVPVVGDGWVALPTREAIGGSSWVLQISAGDSQDIEGGIINDLDIVSLWRIPEDQVLESPELYPWSAGKPLTWLALNSSDPSEPVEIGSIGRQGNFYRGSLPDGINDSGVFIQDGRVVGWTFGDFLDGAFLWAGDMGRNLKPEIRVDDYYRITFANGREEEFVRALAMGDDYSNLDRLAAFARAFQIDPKLSVDRTPDYLKPEAVISQMRLILGRVVQEGFGSQAVGYFDAEILARADDVSLIADVVILTAESFGLEEAVNLTENAIKDLRPQSNREKTQLNELHAGLYQNWLNALLEGGDIQDGWRVYERGVRQRPDDLNIYLFGVKLALVEEDWATAENLLAAKDYPPALRDQVISLQAQVAELKGQHGKILIRFEPGTRQIPVTASINQETSQEFIVDTGASMVTIPFSTARSLGIVISVRNPRRKVFTASGELHAPEVVLDSISLEGFETYNVKALVIDIPNQPGLGLLGLNYLRRFRMDLNTDDGLLMLAPK
ncbi:MAG: TIGR02281 family clan AA aspartic protease [Desulfobacterales bacterium]|jgi:clan AA aspartic protease (TIGR02281 family)